MTLRAIPHKGRVGISSAFVIVVSIIVFIGISCAGQQSPAPIPTPLPAPAPTPTPPPASSLPPPPLLSPQTPLGGKWAADGIISSGEYTRTRTFGEYELHWTGDEKNIYVAIKAKTTGFVAVAVQPGSRMKDADIVFGFVKDGRAAVYDLFSTGDFGPHPPDTEQGGTDNILESGGREEGGYTTIEFKRALDTGDRYDKPLVKGVNKIIWSYGSEDSLTFKHVNRGYGELELP